VLFFNVALCCHCVCDWGLCLLYVTTFFVICVVELQCILEIVVVIFAYASVVCISGMCVIFVSLCIVV